MSTGEAARLSGKAIHVDGGDKELRKHTAEFLTSAGRSLKQGMQSVAKVLGIEIGFFFKDLNAFEKGLAKLSITHRELADYRREARTWAERLNLHRNKVEHEGWALPRAKYRESSGKIVYEAANKYGPSALCGEGTFARKGPVCTSAISAGTCFGRVSSLEARIPH